MPLKPCIAIENGQPCGELSPQRRCPRHRQPPRGGSTRAWRALRDQVFARDRWQCTWTNRRTGERCKATRHLELHHLDGNPRNDDLSNLTTRCFTHNPRGGPR